MRISTSGPEFEKCLLVASRILNHFANSMRRNRIEEEARIQLLKDEKKRKREECK